jgi:hypothetical protein
MHFCVRFLFLSGSLLFLTPLSADVILHNAPQFVKTGQPLRVEAVFSYQQNISRAFLYARGGNTSVFTPILMSRSGSQIYAEIPGYLINNSGVEYYIEVIDSTGKIFTRPENNPERSPIALNISQEKPLLDVVLTHPIERSKIEEKKPRIQIDFIGDAQSFRRFELTIDGQRVTSDTKLVNKSMVVQPREDLKLGVHEIALTINPDDVSQKTEKKWVFEVVPEGMAEIDDAASGPWKSTGSLSLTSQFSETKSEKETRLAYPGGYHTMTASYKAELDKYYFSVGPISVTSQQVEERQPLNSYTVTAGTPNLDTKWGTTSSQFGSLLGSKNFWGSEIKVKKAAKSDKPEEKLSILIAAGQTKKAVEASDDPSGVGSFSQRIYGSAFEASLTKMITFSAGFAHLKDDKNSVKNAGPQIPVEGYAAEAGLQFKFSSFVEWVNVTVAYANADVAAPGVVFRREGAAWKSDIGLDVKKIDTKLTLGYNEMQEDYLNVISGAQGSLRNFSTQSTTKIWKITWTNTGSFNYDNLKNLRPVTNNNLGLGSQLGFSIIPNGNLSLGDNFQRQFTTGNPVANSKTDTNTLTLTAGYGLKIFSRTVSFSTTLAQTDTISDPGFGQQTKNRNQNGNLSLTIPFFSFLNSSFSAGKNISEDLIKMAKSFTDTAAISLTFALFGSKLSLPLSVNYAHSYAQDFTTNNENLSYTGGISGSPIAKHTLAVSATVSNYRDLVNASLNYRQISVNFTYNAQL